MTLATQNELGGAGESNALTGPHRLLATGGLMIAVAMQAADAVIANVALPQLQSDLGGGVELGAWVMTSYLCATAVVAPLTGWLRRRCGARRLFYAALGGFVIGSLLCAVAPSGAALIAFRILQGAGAGVVVPLSQALLLDIHPKERHGQMLALWGAALMVGPIVGPVLGGVITDLASWRWVFAINLPLGLVAIWSTFGLRSKPERADGPRLDGIGVVLLVIAVGALQLTLERGVGRSWLHSPELLGEASITIVAIAALMLRARHAGFTLFRPELLRDVNFAVASFYSFMSFALFFVTIVFVPAIAEGPLHYSATLAGIAIVPRAILIMLMMLIVGQLIERVSYRVLLTSGWVLTAAGLTLLSAVPMGNPLYLIVIGSSVQALGAGLLWTPLSTLAYSTLPSDRRTEAAGVYSLLRQLGFASGTALMTALLRTRLEAQGAAIPGLPADAASLSAYADCFRMMAVAALIVIPGVFCFRLGGAARPVKEAA